MRRIAHISDLHFGCVEPGLAEALLQDLHATPLSLIAISGDFTQRARRSQFRAAAYFLHKLPAPWIAVPGNHDIPLYDFVRRFLAPLNRYRAFISPDLNPTFEDDELVVLGLNTARSLTWISGRISDAQIDQIRSTMHTGRSDKYKVLMTHHPFIPPPRDEPSGIDLVGRAALAVPVIEESRVDLLLAGHLHLGYSGNIASHYPGTNRPVISIQAGTAISRRRRGEPNAYNLITLNPASIQIELRLWRGQSFLPAQHVQYRFVNNHWQLTEDVTIARPPQ